MPAIAPFVTPIQKHFASPVLGAILLLNTAGDLSLYRFNTETGQLKHVWSLGRFKTLQNVQWSPDGKLIAVLCSKNCFIYEVEEGKRVGSLEAFNERSLIQWAQLDGMDVNLLALLDCDNSWLRWSVDGQFALPQVKISASGPVESFHVDSETIATMQVDGTLNFFAAPFVSGQIGNLAAISRALQSLTRVFESVFEGINRLLRFSFDLNAKLSESPLEAVTLRNLLLFGGNCEATLMTANEFLEFKQRLKKLHAELLLSIGDAQASATRFKQTFAEFGGDEAVKLAEELAPRLERVSRSIQHDLADFLLWLEPLVLEEPRKPALPFEPQETALRALKTFLQGKEVIDLSAFKGDFAEIKLELDGRFLALLGGDSSASDSRILLPKSTFKHAPGSKLLSADGKVFDGHAILCKGIPMEKEPLLAERDVNNVVIYSNYIEIK